MNLAVFGDSWPVGVELNKGELPFGDILHKRLGTKNYYNESQEGSTIDSLVLQLDNFANKKVTNCTCIFFITNHAISESFFDEAKQKFDQKKYDDSKFLFQRNIVYNPKNAESYLYLAKIYKSEENEKEELKNLNTTLLLDPKNEEAMHLLINYELKKSNYSKVKELKENFSMICQKLCKEINTIEKSLSDIEPKNGS